MRWMEMLLWFFFGATLCKKCGDARWIKAPRCRVCGADFTGQPELVQLDEALRRRNRPRWYP